MWRGGVSNIGIYADNISTSIANVSDQSIQHSGGVARYKVPTLCSGYALGNGRITMSPKTGMTNFQNQTVWTLEIGFKKTEYKYANNIPGQVLLHNRPAFTDVNTMGLLSDQKQLEISHMDTASDDGY